MAAEKNKEDDFYAALWKQDEQVKAAREVAETAEQIKRNEETLDVLRIQVAAKEAQKEAAKRVVEREAELMLEERELRRREEEFKKNDQATTQETYRRELERNRIQRLRRELKLKEEEQQLEKKILDEASRALNDEKTFTAELREQRIQYEQQYREYIRQLRLEEVKLSYLNYLKKYLKYFLDRTRTTTRPALHGRSTSRLGVTRCQAAAAERGAPGADETRLSNSRRSNTVQVI